MRTLRAGLAAALALAATLTATVGLAQPEALDELVAAELERQRIPGLSVAVLRDGELVVAEGYGFANVEHGVPASADTVYQTGSIGKQLTAALVMTLVEEKRIALDDRLVDHIDDAPDEWSDITVRHMLNHTAGLSNALYGRIDLRRDYTEDELVREIAAGPLDFAPGERWSYSNTGYVLLGVLVGRVTGTFYGDLLRERIFEPLGMTTARIISERDIVPNRAAGYVLVDGELKNQDWVSPTLNSTADGALYATVRDLAKWDAALRDRALLSAESYELMWSPAPLDDGSSAPYGFGWELGEMNGHRFVRHGGRWQGFAAQMTRYVDEGLTVIVMTNLGQANPSVIADGIAGLYNPELAPKQHTAITVDPAILDAYVGDYEIAPGEVISLARDGDRLIANATGQGSTELLAASESLFFIENANVEIELVKGADGAVTHLILRANGAPMEARRIE